MDVARRVWLRFEAVHAVTYFAPESRAAATHAGLRGFWMGYFGFRAAPLGPADATTVTAAFWNFAPRMVQRSIPDAWSYAAPEALVDARATGAADALRRVAAEVAVLETGALDRLDGVARAATVDPTTLPLYSANAVLAVPDDPVARLWQACTTLREHRGDVHVRGLRDAQLDGCAAHVLFAAGEGVPSEVLRDNRGWSEEEWTAAGTRLASRGLLTGDGSITDRGRACRAAVEAATDTAARAVLGSDADADRIAALLDPVARAVRAGDTIPYPNPMGLPPLDGR